MSAAFDVVFGIFVAAILVLAVVAVRWAVRRDRVARARQAQRSGPPGPAPETGGTPTESTPSGAPVAPGSAPKRGTS
jgi:hypothetical protein